ncbi:Threonine/homoserine/homoserine lactone efflux protein [Cupriavidus sp. OV038]|uniref:LysE family translocator n=1 Tax=unclassified Cupriavidus TaxID=2640874 RepID=UPI0008E24F48|nr:MULTISPECIES: LysE family translocator [unclassified Cupriavidus]SFD43561.1 Threonine/homoserine/homoserine lactone efflux protein [Cupriavidus sp. OV038]SFQ14130.1 Threonine/homoserine/homoserine lactone efflux protein [Cupriavidus sp. OV096]
MSPLAEALAVASITLLAVISPGPDFAMVTRNSYLFGRRTGLLCALGIALGVQVHVCYTMFGVAMLIEHAHGWLTAVKLLGAAYLIWIGIKTLRNRTPLTVDTGDNAREAPRLSAWASLRMGFLTNALNPKTTLFVVSTYTQVVDAHTPWAVQLGYGLFMSVAHWAWFSLVAWGFGAAPLRAAMLRRQGLIDKTLGSALCGLGVALGLSNLGR